MNKGTTPRWKKMRTAESRKVESLLRKEFPHADAYRYNSASIRVRVVDPRFERKSNAQRDALVEPYLDQLPDEIQADIMTLLTLAPSEVDSDVMNQEFEDPSPSEL